VIETVAGMVTSPVRGSSAAPGSSAGAVRIRTSLTARSTRASRKPSERAGERERLRVERVAGDRFAARLALVVQGELEVVDPAYAGAESGVDQAADASDRAGVDGERILGAVADHHRPLMPARLFALRIERTAARAEPALAGEFCREGLGYPLYERRVRLGALPGGERVGFDRKIEQHAVGTRAPFADADDVDRAQRLAG
jgi:hypothetical protein